MKTVMADGSPQNVETCYKEALQAGGYADVQGGELSATRIVEKKRRDVLL